MLLAMLIFLFVVDGGGRSLGFDAWLRRKVPAMREGIGPMGWFLHICGIVNFSGVFDQQLKRKANR